VKKAKKQIKFTFEPTISWSGRHIAFKKTRQSGMAVVESRPHRGHRGRDVIGGVYSICPLSWSVHCKFVCDGKYNERRWACTPHPHQPGLNFPSLMDAVATLCVLCTKVWRLTLFTGQIFKKLWWKPLKPAHCC